MLPNARSQFAAFVDSVVRAGPPGLVDLYLERVRETTWEVGDGGLVPREALLREGAAVRRPGSLVSADGLERQVLAALLDVPLRGLVPLAPPALPAPPEPEALAEVFGARGLALRWRAGWAAIVGADRSAEIVRPQLIEVTFPDGHRQLTTWPRSAPFVPAARPAGDATVPRCGRATVLFAPPAAAVLFHELFGHPLEAELLLRGGSPWTGKFGRRIVALPLEVDDVPTDPTLPGSFTTDDEGSPAAARPLVRAGELVGVLADRDTAGAFGVLPGNARRASCHTPPRPRVSNLVVRGHDDEPPPRAEASIEVSSLWSGTVEPRSGTLILAVRAAHALRKGEQQRPYAGFTLAASIDAACAGMIAVGGPSRSTAEPGWCGKNGEVVATGSVTPWLLVAGLEIR